METVAEISGLIVDEGVRCCGIGKMLIAAAEEWARRVGCRVISVRSNVKRNRAHQFYTNNGYEHVKTQKELRKKLTSKITGEMYQRSGIKAIVITQIKKDDRPEVVKKKK